MKILTIAATPFFSDRGCHVRIYNAAKYLQKFGARVKICTYFDGANVAGLDVEKIKKVGWYKKKSPGFSWGKFWLDIKLIFLCRKTIRAFQPDVIHAHLYEGLGVGYIAKKLAFRNVPIVIDLQADLDEEFRNYNQNNYIARRIFVWLSQKLINSCDWLVLSSENLLPKMQTIFRHKGRVAVIRDGVALDLFRNIPKVAEKDREKIEEIKKWKADKKLLVYIGGLSDNKGVWDMLECFKKIAAESDGWKLLVGGFGIDEEKYKNYISDNNLNDSIFITGKVNYFSLPAYLALAEAGIDPKNSSTESSGKIVNLMAAGLPIICFENEFNRARLGNKGLFIKSFDELSQALADVEKGDNIDYDLGSLNEEREIQKLYEIFVQLTKEKQGL